MKHHNNISNFSRSLMILMALFIVLGFPAQVFARSVAEIQAEIAKKQQQADSAAAESGHLHKKAVTVEGQIKELQDQIASIQLKIDSNVKERDHLTKKIEEAQRKLEEQKELLSANIKSMYIEGDISPLEMLASSKNLSDFVDKQEYRDRIKDNITNTLDEIDKLKKELDDKRQAVIKVIEDQKSLRGSLSQKNKEAGNKLSQVNQTKATFDKVVKQRAAEIASLHAQQFAANQSALGGNAVAGDPSKGGYPAYLANAAQDSIADPWGMLNRECVSYTAWRVHQAGKSMPTNWVGWVGPEWYDYKGNAKFWPSNARSIGLTVDGNPGRGNDGTVAISMVGNYGHAMYVESSSGSSVYVSQYNYSQPGEYSEMWVSRSGLQFIHFK